MRPNFYALPLCNLMPRPPVEDGAQSLSIESQTEAVPFSKFRNLCFSLFCIEWPETLQLLLVYSAVMPCRFLQTGFNFLGERVHRLHRLKMLAFFGPKWLCVIWLSLCKNWYN
jgi:hypothetical protein